MLEFDLVIVRHAEAIESLNLNADSERRLTPRGEKQANEIAQLRKMIGLPKPDMVFSSGYRRAEQTLERALPDEVLSVIRDKQFSPEGSVETAWTIVLTELEARALPTRPCVWIVGHNPHIERLLLHIAPRIGQATRPFKKATVAWLRLTVWQKDETEATLKAYIPSH